MLVDIALFQGTFTYKVPKKLAREIQIGFLVKVPFKTKQLNGWVIKIVGRCKPVGEPVGGTSQSRNRPSILKEIQNVYSPDFCISPQLIELGKRAADYYQATPGAFFELMFPSYIISTGRCEPLLAPTSGRCEPSLAPLLPGSLPGVLSEPLRKREFKSILLYGSQRQGIYFKAIEQALSYGMGIILLTPEITLANLTFSLIQKNFGNIVALLHSGLKRDMRRQEWYSIKQGRAKIVVGTMSAIFAPVSKPGLIIVDEEHSTGYKSEKYPAYSARTVAFIRAKIESCLHIQGSATPTIESFHNARTKKTSLLRLTSAKTPPSKICIVDMRKEATPIFSNRMRTELEKYIKRNERILLFLNKKGFASFILCEDCGYVPKCPNCNISLVYYKADLSMRCRYCGYTIRAPAYCPQCKGTNLSRKGIGTARVEKEFLKLFPGVSIFRLDRDTVSKEYIRHIFKAFESKEFQVLLGTQIIIKPHFLPAVGLVGVISADTGLNLPDFRAGERMFSLLLQLISKGEKVILQTYNLGHRILKYIVKQDLIGFYKTEELARKELNYPPYSHLVRVSLTGRKELQLQEKVHKLEDKFKQRGLKFIGPSHRVGASPRSHSPGRCEPVGGTSQSRKRKLGYQFLIKVAEPADLHLLQIVPSGTAIDVDPIQFS